jgi:hypothetical protein
MKNEIIKGIFGLVFFSVVIFFIYDLFRIELSRPKPKLSNTRVQHLKDSFQMEYYKKQLESYPQEHSKINNGD